MPQPYDYSINAKPVDPNAFTSGMEIGQGLVDARRAATAYTQQQATMRAQQAAQADYAALPPNAPLEQLEALRKKHASVLGGTGANMAADMSALKKNEDDKLFEIANMVFSQKPDDAIETLGRRAVAFDEDPTKKREAQAARDLAIMIDHDPEGSRREMWGSVVMRDPERADKLLEWDRLRRQQEQEDRLQTQQGKGKEAPGDQALRKVDAAIEEAKARAELTRLRAEQIRAKVEEAKAKAETKAKAKDGAVTPLNPSAPSPGAPKLTTSQTKDRDAAARKAADAEISAKDSETLGAELADLAAQDASKGMIARTGEAIKREITGDLDAVTQARKKYAGFVATGVSKNLPPGAASDMDVLLASKPFPEDTRDLAGLSKFIGAISRIEKRSQQLSGFEAEYIGQNGGLGPTIKARKIRGVEIPAGMPYDQARSMFMAAVPYGSTAAPTSTAPPTSTAATGAMDMVRVQLPARDGKPARVGLVPRASVDAILQRGGTVIGG